MPGEREPASQATALVAGAAEKGKRRGHGIMVAAAVRRVRPGQPGKRGHARRQEFGPAAEKLPVEGLIRVSAEGADGELALRSATWRSPVAAARRPARDAP